MGQKRAKYSPPAFPQTGNGGRRKRRATEERNCVDKNPDVINELIN
jgi:hypothetical protein